MSNFKKTIKKLEKTNENWLNNSKCFDKLVELYNEKDFAKEIITTCQNLLKLDNKNKFNTQYWNRRNKLTFTQKDKKRKLIVMKFF